MRCPECGIECRVQAQQRGQDILLRFVCRNPQCPRKGEQVAEKAVDKDETP